MSLQQFTLVTPYLLPGQVFEAISTALPSDKIAQAIEQTHSRERRSRLLPTHLVVCLVIAFSFWSQDSAKDILKNILDGLGKAHLQLSTRWTSVRISTETCGFACSPYPIYFVAIVHLFAQKTFVFWYVSPTLDFLYHRVSNPCREAIPSVDSCFSPLLRRHNRGYQSTKIEFHWLPHEVQSIFPKSIGMTGEVGPQACYCLCSNGTPFIH